MKTPVPWALNSRENPFEDYVKETKAKLEFNTVLSNGIVSKKVLKSVVHKLFSLLGGRDAFIKCVVSFTVYDAAAKTKPNSLKYAVVDTVFLGYFRLIHVSCDRATRHFLARRLRVTNFDILAKKAARDIGMSGARAIPAAIRVEALFPVL